VNEAALLAARNHRQTVAQADIAEAIERMQVREAASLTMEKRLSPTTSGSCACRLCFAWEWSVEKISIVPRGMAALGYTLQLPEDRFLMDQAELQGQVPRYWVDDQQKKLCLAASTGASNDLQRATVAERMVMTYGMVKC